MLSAFAIVLLWRPQTPAAPADPPSSKAQWPIPPAELRVVRSAGNYLVLPLGGREILVRLPLHVAARRLAPHGFVRVHRTALVNLDRVTAVGRRGRRLIVILDDGTEIAVGRAYARDVQAQTFLSIDDYEHVGRWARQIGARPAVKRGRIVGEGNVVHQSSPTDLKRLDLRLRRAAAWDAYVGGAE